MNNPGSWSLGSWVLTAAGIYVPAAGDELGVANGLDLSGLLACSVQLTFDYASGGGTGKAYLQTSLDQANQGGMAGGTFVDIACVTFAVTSKAWVLNLSALTPRTAAIQPSDGALADDTTLDGILGDRFRLKIVTLSTAYAGPTAFSGVLVLR